MTHRIRYATPYGKVSALKLAKTTLNCCSVVSWDDEGIIRAQAKYGKIERSSFQCGILKIAMIMIVVTT